jgi:hypothetical protein
VELCKSVSWRTMRLNRTHCHTMMALITMSVALVNTWFFTPILPRKPSRPPAVPPASQTPHHQRSKAGVGTDRHAVGEVLACQACSIASNGFHSAPIGTKYQPTAQPDEIGRL